MINPPYTHHAPSYLLDHDGPKKHVLGHLGQRTPGLDDPAHSGSVITSRRFPGLDDSCCCRPSRLANGLTLPHLELRHVPMPAPGETVLGDEQHSPRLPEMQAYGTT